jgi:hypothetical protein
MLALLLAPLRLLAPGLALRPHAPTCSHMLTCTPHAIVVQLPPCLPLPVRPWSQQHPNQATWAIARARALTHSSCCAPFKARGPVNPNLAAAHHSRHAAPHSSPRAERSVHSRLQSVPHAAADSLCADGALSVAGLQGERPACRKRARAVLAACCSCTWAELPGCRWAGAVCAAYRPMRLLRSARRCPQPTRHELAPLFSDLLLVQWDLAGGRKLAQLVAHHRLRHLHASRVGGGKGRVPCQSGVGPSSSSALGGEGCGRPCAGSRHGVPALCGAAAAHVSWVKVGRRVMQAWQCWQCSQQRATIVPLPVINCSQC